MSEITETVICNKVAKGASVITEPFTLTDFQTLIQRSVRKCYNDFTGGNMEVVLFHDAIGSITLYDVT